MKKELFCKYCGAKISGQVKFCPRCGNKNNIVVKKKALVISISVAIILLVCILLGIGLKLRMMREKSKDSGKLLENRISKESIFTPYLKLNGQKYTKLSDEYTDWTLEGVSFERHEVKKSFDGLPGNGEVSYLYFTENVSETIQKNILRGPYFTISKTSTTLYEVKEAIEEIYGKPNLTYLYPDIEPPEGHEEEKPVYEKCIQWNSVENNQYSLTLMETEDLYSVNFANVLEELPV